MLVGENDSRSPALCGADALHHQGMLVSFYSRLSSKAVCRGDQALQLIDPG